MEYQANHVKRDPVTGDVAIRTVFPLSDIPQRALMEWLIASATTGPRHVASAEVQNWDDLFTPDESQVATLFPPGS